MHGNTAFAMCRPFPFSRLREANMDGIDFSSLRDFEVGVDKQGHAPAFRLLQEVRS